MVAAADSPSCSLWRRQGVCRWQLALLPPAYTSCGVGAGRCGPVLEEPSSDSGVEEAAPKARPLAQEELLVEADTHRVFLRGTEVVPPLSREQYDLLAYLHQNRGKLCVREEIIRRVWPEVEATGVSEEALDALVHRLRERLQTAGASRPLIVTVRGQGFRLDI